MKDLVKQNKILEVIVGSTLYGTNTPTSDQDFSGIFIAPKRFYLGLDKIEEVDLSIVSKQENGKNDQNAVDMKFYELRKFMKLAMENNPNILEHLFVPDDKIVFENHFGHMLLNNAHLFPHQGLKQKFVGYGLSQLHKAHIKIDNYDDLKFANEWLFEKQVNEAGRLIAEYRNETVKGMKFYEHHVTIGDINISLSDKLSKVYNKVVERLSKVGNREELYTKYGMDTKFLSHACRLLMEGKELLTTGKLEFPVKDKEFLLDIRNGKHKSEEIISYANNLIKELDEEKFEIVVPNKPKYKEIEILLINMVESYWLSVFD